MSSSVRPPGVVEVTEASEGRLDQIDAEVELTGPLDQDQRLRLLEISERCPVHRTLVSEIVIRTRLVP